MSAWRVVGVVASVLSLVPAGRAADTYPLAEVVQAGDCFRVELEMKLSGALRVQKFDKPVSIELKASAGHAYPERVLSVGADGLPDKSVRFYETAKSAVTVNGASSERSLRPERRLMVAQRHNDQALVYCPAGPLTRAELDLTGDQFDSLAVVGLLPGKAVAVGDTWKISSSVAQALCLYEGLTEQNLIGKLEEVKDGVATFSVAGATTGIDRGAMVKMNVTAKGQFDLKAKRLVALEWTQKDERDGGPVSPSSAVTTTTTLKRAAVERPDKLSDVAVVSVPEGFAPPAPMTNLEARDAKGRYELLYARDWHTVAQTEEQQVLRLMDRGDFVAQATVTPWTAAEKGKHIAPDDFRAAMLGVRGLEVEKELQAGEVPADNGRWVYRLSVQGKLEGVEVVQNFYVVAGPDGEQVVVAFTMAPKQVEKLGARDLAFVGSMDVPAAKK